MNSTDLISTSPGLTHRRLDYWCDHGVFGDTKARPGRGTRRDFDAEDVLVARTLARVSYAMRTWRLGPGSSVGLYRHIAAQVREGGDVTVTLAPGIRLSVDREHE